MAAVGLFEGQNGDIGRDARKRLADPLLFLGDLDTQREKLADQLREVEAAERVLARYGKDTRAAKTASARTPTTATRSS
jgi:hypothetical protein